MSRRFGTAAITLVLACTALVGLGASSAGAADGPTVTVTPSSGLRDGQTVTVTGTGWTDGAPDADWTITQCSRKVLSDLSFSSAFLNCDISSSYVTTTRADAAGAISAPFVVRTTFPTVEGNTPTVTCGAEPGDCAVLVAHVTGSGQFVAAAAPISFGPPVPTVRDCVRAFLSDHQVRPAEKLHQLLVCVFTALTHRPH